MHTTVREGLPQDTAAIARLLAILMADHGLTPLPRADLIRAAEEVLQLPDAWYYIAEVDGSVVGMLQLNRRYSTWLAAPYGYIEDFCVVPSLRSRGIGAALLAHVASVARSKGWVRLDLDVSSSLPDSIRFYKRHGYRDTGSTLYRLPLP